MQDSEWTRRPLLSTFDGNNRQMLEGICDSLSHVRTVFVPQSNESITSPLPAPGAVYANTPNSNQLHIATSDTSLNPNPGALRNSPVTVSLPAKVTSKMTRQNRCQYNDRAMRKIRDDLTLFDREPSGPNSGLVNGVDSCVANKHLLQQLAALGYDESVASRALNLSGNKSVEAALEILQRLPLVEKNGINKTSYLYKLIRKPSFEEKYYRQTQSSPVSISDSNSVRSDSPGLGPLNKPISTQEPPHIIATQAINMVSSKNKVQVSPNPMVNGHYTPPPLPPRVPLGMPMLQVMSHGQTPPPSGHLIASDQIPHGLSSQSVMKPSAQTATSAQHQQYHGAPPEHVQQLLKRMSPMQTDNMRAHGIVFSTPTFNHQQPQQQSSGPASGGLESIASRATTVSMPVAQGHQPIIMQNGQPQNMQNSAALSQHMQGLNLNSPSSSSTTSSNHSNNAIGNAGPSRVTIKYTHPHTQPPPPYPLAHNNNTQSRRSPIGIQIRPNPDHTSAVQNQRQARDGRGHPRAEYDTQITISSSSKLGEQEGAPGDSITVNIPTKRANPSPVPMHAWGAKHGTIIMQSVKSREVAKPVPQTATVPTSPAQQSGGGNLNAQNPSPNFVSCVQTQVNALSPSSHPSHYTQIHPQAQYQPPLIQQHVNKMNPNVQIQIRHELNNHGAINVMPGRGANKHVDIRNPHVSGSAGPQPASIHIQIQKQPRHYAPVFSTPTVDSFNRVAIETPSSTPRSGSPVSRTTNQSPMSILSTTSTTTSTNSDIVPDRPPPPYPGPGRAVNVESPLSPCQPPLPPRVPLSSQVISKHPLALPISGMCTIPSTTQPYNSSTVSSCTLEHDEHSDLEVQSLDQDSSTTTDEQTESTTTDEQIENSIGGDYEMASSQKKHRCTSPIPERKPEAKKNDYLRHDCTVKNLSPDAFKFFMEQHVENLLKSHQQRMHRRLQLENEMAKVGLSQEDQCQMRRMLNQKESNYIRLKRAKMDKSLFKRIKTLGIGAFGEVTLVRKKDVGHLHAMKTLRKSDVLQRNQVAHVKAERDILAEADNEWVVKLYYSFQDENNLYFVMDYVPGGDLMGLLIRLGIFQEDLARFYVAELVLAIESVHKMGFIHRDIKPDNVLIDRDGHIKLTDFGLCTGFRWTHNSKYYQKDLIHGRQDSMDVSCGRDHIECNCAVLKPLERRRQRDHQRCLAHSLVGTPNYIAPEVLKREGYTSCCDWWSVGVILYEMLVGQPPFYAPSPAETQYKVIHWMDTLRIPSEPHLSSPAADLITKLCRNPEDRLGANGFTEIKNHKFFSPISFEGLRRQQAPYVPEILYPTDTSNFDAVDPERCRGSDSDSDESTKKDIYENGKHPEHAFYEFTFRRFFDDGGHPYPQVKDPESNAPVYV